MKKIILAALSVTILASCLSSKVRDEVLLPAASLAWSGVRADLQRGISDAVEDGDLGDRSVLDAQVALLDAVLRSGGDRVQLRSIPWESTLRPYAVRGIQDRVDDGEVSQMIADTSLMERLNNFSYAIQQLMLARMSLPLPAEREYWAHSAPTRVALARQ